MAATGGGKKKARPSQGENETVDDRQTDQDETPTGQAADREKGTEQSAVNSSSVGRPGEIDDRQQIRQLKGSLEPARLVIWSRTSPG